MRSLLPVALSAAALGSCSASHAPPDSGPTLADDAPATPRDAPRPADAPPAPDAPPAIDAPPPLDAPCVTGGESPSPQLRELHATVISPGCDGGSRFCHGESRAFLMTTPELTLANLVGVEGCSGVRVVPCRPEESRVLAVITEGGEPCGRPLEIAGTHPRFPPETVQAIEAWILAGAR